MIPFAAVNLTTLAGFLAVLAIVAGITVWASRKSRSTSQFLTAEGSLSAGQNAWAIAGDYMSSATLLGGTGLVFVAGLDGMYLLVAALIGFVIVLLLIAERMRNSGKFTLGDILAFRLKERPIRAAMGFGTLTVSVVYLLSVIVGGGVLMNALLGFSFTVSVLLTMAILVAFVLAGGMLATSWVQIIKAFLLVTLVSTLAIWVLGENGFSLNALFADAAQRHPAGEAYLANGLLWTNEISAISTFMAFAFGVAGLPHVLIRFFTVPDADSARRSVGWGTIIIGAVFIAVILIGFGARTVLPDSTVARIDPAGNLTAPILAEYLGGGKGSLGGDLLLAFFGGVALATILAVMAGIIIASSGIIAHDLWKNVVRRGRMSDREEVLVARVGAAAVAAAATVLALAAGSGFNLALLVALAFSIAAGANAPAMLLALTWRRFNTTGAITGMFTGLVSAVVLIVLSPAVWPGPDSEGSPVELANPAILAIPLGFLGCYLGTVFSRREPRASTLFNELLVRQHTGLGVK